MSRSSRRRSSSWVWTSRSREARSSAARSASSASRWASSARSRALRRASPAWAARPANSRSSTGVRADRSFSWSRSTPSSSPPWRTGSARRPAAEASSAPSRGSGGEPAPAAPVADGGQVAAGTSRSPTASHTCAQRALVPSASTRAIRSGSWSAGYSAATVAENRLRTSYGDGAVTQAPVHGGLQPALHRLEPERHDHGGEHGQAQVGGVRAPDQRTAAEDHHQVDGQDEHGQPSQDHDPLLPVVQPAVEGCAGCHARSLLRRGRTRTRGAGRRPGVGLAARRPGQTRAR